jgi:hypothetical protein
MMTLYFMTLVGQAFATPENTLNDISIEPILAKEESKNIRSS